PEATPLEARVAVDEAAADVHHRQPHGIWIGVGVGSGSGWHARRELEGHTDHVIGAGLSPGGSFFIAPEIGYQINERLGIAVQTRHQFLPSGEGSGDAVSPPPTSAHAVLVHGYYTLGEWKAMQLVGSGTLGAGAFRMTVPPR